MQTCSDPVHILLGTYNGARYVREQIFSIQRQKVDNWRMLVRDDGSTDETLEMLKTISSADRRIRLVEDQEQNLGVIGNYARLMVEARNEGAKVVFFSDQDDLWLPDKIIGHLQHLESLQNQYGKEMPLLVHSDLMVVDEKINILNRSFMNYQGIGHENDSQLKILLVQNFVTACASAINRPLLELALPLPEKILMHDWWIALCAAACGRIGYISHPTVLYRQHGTNVIGAKNFWDMLNPFKTIPLDRWKTGKKHFLGSIYQAKALMKRMNRNSQKLNDDTAILAQAYVNCLTLNAAGRILRIIRLGLRRQGHVRQVLFLLRLILTKHNELTTFSDN